MGITVSIIGAGSAVFSATVVRDLCVTPGLRGSHIVLMDTDEERLQSIGLLADRLSQEPRPGRSPARRVARRAAERAHEASVRLRLITNPARQAREATSALDSHWAGRYGSSRGREAAVG